MHDPAPGQVSSSKPPREPVLFAREGSYPASTPQKDRPWLPWVIASIVIVLIVGLAFLLGGHHRSSIDLAHLGPDPYAGHLVVSNVQLSQTDNFAGGQLTYIDGTISNQGDRTVTAVNLRALFANDVGNPPQAEIVPLTLIRTREPYVDTEPVSAAPLAPGSSQDFRLIFDDISSEWNQQIPKLNILQVTTKN